MKIFSVLFLFVSFNTYAGDWKKLNFTSDQNTAIEVSYQVSEDAAYKFAKPFYVEAKREDLNGISKVRAVIVQNCKGQRSSDKATFILDLEYYANHFSGNFEDAKLLQGNQEIRRFHPYSFPLIKAKSTTYPLSCTHELALVIDGQWQKFGGLRNKAMSL